MTVAEHLQPALDRKLPAALVAAFLLQTAGALFWAGQAAERITVLERTVANDQGAIEHVAVLEDRIAAMTKQLDRIEAKLDRQKVQPSP
jgi:uncharacterized small protein (DUF1192 family)